MNIFKDIEPLILDVHSLIIPISTSNESDSTDTGDYRIKLFFFLFDILSLTENVSNDKIATKF